MRFEYPGLLHFLKAVAFIGAWWFLWYFWRIDFDLSELTYQIGKIDWSTASFFIAPILLLLVMPLWRLFREYRIWKVLYQPFRVVEDPFIDVDMKEESCGDIFLRNGPVVKGVATFARRSGVIVRKAAYPRMFPTFEITWNQISHIYFVEMHKNDDFGPDPFGPARVTLSFAEEFVLALPWRGRFKKYIPDHIGFQNEPDIA